MVKVWAGGGADHVAAVESLAEPGGTGVAVEREPLCCHPAWLAARVMNEFARAM